MLEFLPEQSNVVFSGTEPTSRNGPTIGEVPVAGSVFTLSTELQQNGEKPDKLSGVLVSDQPLIGDAKAVYISEFPVSQKPPGAGEPTGGMVPSGYPDAAALSISGGTYAGSTTVVSGTVTSGARRRRWDSGGYHVAECRSQFECARQRARRRACAGYQLNRTRQLTRHSAK